MNIALMLRITKLKIKKVKLLISDNLKLFTHCDDFFHNTLHEMCNVFLGVTTSITPQLYTPQ